MSNPIHLDLTVEGDLLPSDLQPTSSDPNARPSIEEWANVKPNCVIYALRCISDPTKLPYHKIYLEDYIFRFSDPALLSVGSDGVYGGTASPI